MHSRKAAVAATVAIIALVSAVALAAEPTIAKLKSGDVLELAKRFAKFNDALPDAAKFGMSRLTAFEEHPQFVYAAGDLPAGAGKAAGVRRVIFVKPATFIINDQTVKITSGVRSVVVMHAGAGKAAECTSTEKDGTAHVKVVTGDRVCDLSLPGGDGMATIAVTEGKKAVLATRPLPAGIMPHGPKGVRMIDGWDGRYRGKGRAPWDRGKSDGNLVAAVEGGRLKPGRAVVLGCGSGTNAIYLASKGFDVTAMDVAPTAIAIAKAKADKAKVTVRWLVADVLAPPKMKPFDVIFDRGCYHGVRRVSATGYVKTADTLSRPGTMMLVLAGNANEPRHYGPPRVDETHLVGDFAKTWDFVHLQEHKGGAWFWSALMRRRAK